jgi:lysophospholipid acyltransferase (LPLAT)-like uncharacterized protein
MTLGRSLSRERFPAMLGSTILRLLFLTLRLEIDDRAGLSKNVPRGPVIICFWHNRILGITLTFIRHYPEKARKGVSVLTIASRDGEILAQLVGRFGMGAVCGSSSRRDRAHCMNWSIWPKRVTTSLSRLTVRVELHSGEIRAESLRSE